MLGAVPLRDGPRPFPLIERGIVEADGECLHPLASLGQRRDHRRRIDATTQEDAERHIGNRHLPGRPGERTKHSAGPVLLIRLGVEAPVPPGMRLRDAGPAISAGAHHHAVSWRELGAVLPDALGIGYKTVGEIVEQRGVVDPAGKRRPGREGLGLRCKKEGAGECRAVQRLLSRAIPRAEQGPLDLVPDREGEHPGEPRQRALAPEAKGFQQHFGVARGPEPDAVRLQLFLQLPVVVELAVVDQQKAAVMGGEGLVGLGKQIDDGQPAVTEPDFPIAREPGR